jgi:hypothetical protein
MFYNYKPEVTLILKILFINPEFWAKLSIFEFRGRLKARSLLDLFTILKSFWLKPELIYNFKSPA